MKKTYDAEGVQKMRRSIEESCKKVATALLDLENENKKLREEVEILQLQNASNERQIAGYTLRQQQEAAVSMAVLTESESQRDEKIKKLQNRQDQLISELQQERNHRQDEARQHSEFVKSLGKTRAHTKRLQQQLLKAQQQEEVRESTLLVTTHCYLAAFRLRSSYAANPYRLRCRPTAA